MCFRTNLVCSVHTHFDSTILDMFFFIVGFTNVKNASLTHCDC